MMARLLAPVPIAILSVWLSSATVAAHPTEHDRPDDDGITGSSLAAQGTLGLDVPPGSRLSVFGHVGFALPVRDAGSGHTITTAGVRVGL